MYTRIRWLDIDWLQTTKNSYELTTSFTSIHVITVVSNRFLLYMDVQWFNAIPNSMILYYFHDNNLHPQPLKENFCKLPEHTPDAISTEKVKEDII